MQQEDRKARGWLEDGSTEVIRACADSRSRWSEQDQRCVTITSLESMTRAAPQPRQQAPAQPSFEKNQKPRCASQASESS